METENKPKRDMNPVTQKVLVILGLALALLLPLSQVDNQIVSRREYEAVAQKEVARGWGDKVAFSSPILTAADEKLSPATSETVIEVESKEKKRGVFRVPVYIATLKSKVTFHRATTVKNDLQNAKRMIEQDHLAITVEPLSSLQNFKVKDVASGKELHARLVNGEIRLSAADLPTRDFFDAELEIEITARGTGPLSYQSIAGQDKVTMKGNWTKPQFAEDVLPSETKLSAKGFEATWTLSAMSKTNADVGITVGLNHLWVGTDYTMIERAVKYGILFIALTFLLVFIVEFMSKAKIHPLQYGLIGLSISIFYLLLLAISETTGFDIAYVISSLAVTGLIVFYVGGFMKQKKFVRMILAEQIVLSGFFYVLLSLEERAFLIGSLGLFTALAIFMTITRKFDWYTGSFKPQTDAQG